MSTSEDNEYPQYIKLHALPDYKGEPIERYLKEKCIFNGSTVFNCDGDRAFFSLEKLTQLENSVVDYTDENHKLRWLNTFKQITNSVRAYEKQFLLAKWERWSFILIIFLVILYHQLPIHTDV